MYREDPDHREEDFRRSPANQRRVRANRMTGKEAYEEDVRRKPFYHTGEPRKTWDQLGSVEQWSWNKDPKPREYNVVKRSGT